MTPSQSRDEERPQRGTVSEKPTAAAGAGALRLRSTGGALRLGLATLALALSSLVLLGADATGAAAAFRRQLAATFAPIDAVRDVFEVDADVALHPRFNAAGDLSQVWVCPKRELGFLLSAGREEFPWSRGEAETMPFATYRSVLARLRQITSLGSQVGTTRVGDWGGDPDVGEYFDAYQGGVVRREMVTRNANEDAVQCFYLLFYRPVTGTVNECDEETHGIPLVWINKRPYWASSAEFKKMRPGQEGTFIVAEAF